MLEQWNTFLFILSTTTQIQVCESDGHESEHKFNFSWKSFSSLTKLKFKNHLENERLLYFGNSVIFNLKKRHLIHKSNLFGDGHHICRDPSLRVPFVPDGRVYTGSPQDTYNKVYNEIGTFGWDKKVMERSGERMGSCSPPFENKIPGISLRN